MKHNTQKEGLPLLDSQIRIRRFLKSCDDFDKQMKKEIHGDIKHCVMAIASVLFVFLLTTNTNNSVFLYGAGAIVIAVEIINKTTSSKKMKQRKNNDITENVEPNDIFMFTKDKVNEKEKSVDECLEEMQKINASDSREYYNENYSDFVEISVREKDGDNLENSKPRLTLYENGREKKKDYLSKNESIMKICDDIYLYYKLYKIAPLKINKQEWNSFVNAIYNQLTLTSREEVYYDILSLIVREVLIEAIVAESKSITLNNFLEAISVLEFSGFSKEDCQNIKKEILLHSSHGQIINFQDYKKIKTR